MKKSMYLLLIGAALIVGAYFLRQYETKQEFDEDETEDPAEDETEDPAEDETEIEKPVKDEKAAAITTD